MKFILDEKLAEVESQLNDFKIVSLKSSLNFRSFLTLLFFCLNGIGFHAIQ